MECPQCHNINNNDANVCQYCGYSFHGENNLDITQNYRPLSGWKRTGFMIFAFTFLVLGGLLAFSSPMESPFFLIGIVIVVIAIIAMKFSPINAQKSNNPSRFNTFINNNNTRTLSDKMSFCQHCGAQLPQHYYGCPVVNQMQPPPDQGQYYEPPRNQRNSVCPNCENRGYTRNPYTDMADACYCPKGDLWLKTGGKFRTEFRR